MEIKKKERKEIKIAGKKAWPCHCRPRSHSWKEAGRHARSARLWQVIWQLSVSSPPLAGAPAGQLTLIYGTELSCLPLTCSLCSHCYSLMWLDGFNNGTWCIMYQVEVKNDLSSGVCPTPPPPKKNQLLILFLSFFSDNARDKLGRVKKTRWNKRQR